MNQRAHLLTIIGCAALLVATAACSDDDPLEPGTGETGIELAMGRVAVAGRRGDAPGYGCAIKRDETLVCWGLNTAGRLGIGSIDRDGVPYPATPVLIPAGVKLSFVTTGFLHACAVALDGRLFCWGANDYGQLGTGDRETSAVPVQVAAPNGVRFARVAVSSTTTCALSTTGTVYCWGLGSSGQVGDGTLTGRVLEPTPLAGVDGVRFVDVALGYVHGCAVSEAGEVYCWGLLDYDNCGCESAYTPTPAKMELPTTDRFVRIAGGPGTTTCALTEGGEAFCWTPGTVEPTRANVNRALIALSVGINHACGLDKDGTPVCWVLPRDFASPAVLDVPKRSFSAVAAGGDATCGIVADGTELVCWGTDELSVLGDALAL